MPLHSYGYQSNTRIKFVLVLALADAVVRDIDVKTVGPRQLRPARSPTDLSHLADLPRHPQRLHLAHLEPLHLRRDRQPLRPLCTDTESQVRQGDGRRCRRTSAEGRWRGGSVGPFSVSKQLPVLYFIRFSRVTVQNGSFRPSALPTSTPRPRCSLSSLIHTPSIYPVSHRITRTSTCWLLA